MYKVEKSLTSFGVGGKAGYVLIYTPKDESKPSLEFNISQILSRKSKDDGDEYEQFALLNSYLEYKGSGFQNEYYDKLSKSYQYINEVSIFNDLIPLPHFIVHDILDMFDLDDLFVFLRDVYKINVPSELMDVFDDSIESDGRGTRVQTYLKSDYIKLASLSVIVKSVIGVIGQFAYIKAGDLNTIHKEYILFNFLQSYPRIFHSEAMEKLIGLVEKLIALPTNEKNTEERAIIEKQLSREELPVSIVATVVIQKIGILALTGDNNDKNIVTKIYNYIKNKLKSNGDVTKTIRDKSPRDGAKDENMDSESPVETYRSLTDIEQGKLIEYNWALRSVDVIMRQLPESIRSIINMQDVYNALDFIRCFESEIPLTKTQIDLIACLSKPVIDPRCLDRIQIRSILNLMAVNFAYLWALDCKTLALILTSRVYNTEAEDELMLNSVVNKSRISKELKEKLDEIYPYKRVINETTTANVVVESIDLMAADIFSKSWVPNAYKEYLDVVYGETGSNNIVVPELKILLAEMFIKNEERL